MYFENSTTFYGRVMHFLFIECILKILNYLNTRSIMCLNIELLITIYVV